MRAPKKKPVAALEARTGDCALYIRVSTFDQGDRYSLASQLKKLRELAAREGNRVREDWIFTDKHSGKMESRPEFDKMKALVRAGGPVKVYIFDVSRFARKTMDALWLAADFKRHGVALGFYEMPYEDTPTGRLTFTQMCAVAEYVGEKIVEDSRRGRIQMLEMGKLPHGSAPYGYINEGGKLAIDPGMSSAAGVSKRQVVEMIFGWRRTGWKSGRIIHELDERGILSPGYRGKGGVWVAPGLWVRQVLLRMLVNRTYMGENVCCGVVVPCEAIISRELFEEVQLVNRSAKARTTGREARFNYLLSSYIWCRCGHRMKSNPGMRSGLNSGHRNYPGYKCNREDPRTRKQLCPAPRVRCDLIEPVAFDAIWGMVTQPKRLLAQGWTFFKSREKSGSAVTKLETESTRLERSIAGLQLMIDKGAGDAAKAIESILGKQRRLAEIAGELRDAGRVVDLPTERQVEAAQRRIVDPRTKDRLTFADKRSILECVQDLRMEYYDGDLTITGAVPMPAANKCNPTQDHGYTYLTTIPFEIKLKVGA